MQEVRDIPDKSLAGNFKKIRRTFHSILETKDILAHCEVVLSDKRSRNDAERADAFIKCFRCIFAKQQKDKNLAQEDEKYFPIYSLPKRTSDNINLG